jgi:SOS response regulatory protein OraA/RecX
MKRFIIYIFMLMLVPMTSMAQAMSDAQVAQYITKEHAMGTSNTQIVTKLIQKGVNIQQIRRVRKQFEKMQNESSLGSNT